MRKVSVYKVKRPTRASPNRHVWQVRWYGPEGKRYCDTIGDCRSVTKRQAEAARRDKQSKMDCGIIKPGRTTQMPLQEYAAYDRKAIADRRPKTALAHQAAFNIAKRALGATIRINQIRRAQVAQLKAYMQKRPYRPASVDATIRVLRAAWNRGQRDDLIVDNPFAGQGVKWDPHDSRIFTDEEIDAMVGAGPDDWWRLFIRLLATTGLRLTEAIHLRWCDMDLDAPTVKVCRHDGGRFTVGGESYPLLPWNAKAMSSYRTIDFLEQTAAQLRRYKLKADGSAYVFIDLDRLRTLDRRLRVGTLRPTYEPVNNVLRRFQRLIQPRARALLAEWRGVPVDEVEWRIGRIHDMRDSYISHMAWRVPPNVLQRLAGHSDIKTTMRYYAHATPGESDAVRSALSASGLGGKTDAQVTREPSDGKSFAAIVTEDAAPDSINADCPRSSVG